MMAVITVILIVASFSTPIYQTALVRTREAVLRDDLFTLRFLIDRFTLDNHRSPAHLEELVTKGYLGRLPTDPFTGSNETWLEVKEPAPASPEYTVSGVCDVHSGSDQLSLQGETRTAVGSATRQSRLLIDRFAVRIGQIAAVGLAHARDFTVHSLLFILQV
jgi:general secretion pathway protein G